MKQEQKFENSVLLEKSPEEEIDSEKIDYTDEEEKYLKALQVRLENAKNKRSMPFDEFDGLSYDEYWNKNELLANTQATQSKKDVSEVSYQSGTLRTKLFSFVSTMVSSNLLPEVLAFNESNLAERRIGTAIGDIIDKTTELEDDEDKKIMRYYELFKQGDVFVEEIWDDRNIVEKEPVKNYNGEFRVKSIKKKVKPQKGVPKRNLVSNLSVYLGDLTKYNIDDQPYIFVVQYKQYDDAKKIYGKFENFKYVKKNYVGFSGSMDNALINNMWRLDPDMKDGMVEIIKYSDKPNQEYQIILNGVPMLPIGFPFPWGYTEYNLVQQHYRPIRADFAYGKSFIFENKNPIQLLDAMIRLGYLKTCQSFLVPMVNVSGRVLSSKVLLPGKMTTGIPPGSLQPITPNIGQGVTNAEFAMIQEFSQMIDAQTVSQTFTGVPEKGEMLATQINALQKQSRLMLGVTFAAVSFMEKKLTYLRLLNILANWFNPIDKVVDEARGIINNRYRIVTTEKVIDKKGSGVGIVYPTDNLPPSSTIATWEEVLEEKNGYPVEIVAINPQALKEARLTWVVNVNSRDKKTSEISKLLLSQMVNDARMMGLPLNQAYLQEEFAQVWEQDAGKLFAPEAPTPMQGALGGQPQTAGMGGQVQPTVKKPILPVEGGKLGGELNQPSLNPNLSE
jgi:hypothetical protein